MSPIGPAAAQAAKLAAKYGPHAVQAWHVGGKQAMDFAKTQQARQRAKRMAIDKARTVTEGSVLRQRFGEDVVWVVYAGDEPIAVYPPSEAPLADIVQHADLSQRQTPEQYDEARLRRRLGEGTRKAAARARSARPSSRRERESGDSNEAPSND